MPRLSVRCVCPGAGMANGCAAGVVAKQSLTVFQPLVPPDWKMNLREGSLYAQVAFSAAAGQG